MNGFDKACPSGNSLVDGFKEPVRYLETEKEVADYIADRDFTEEEVKDIWAEFESKGCIKL